MSFAENGSPGVRCLRDDLNRRDSLLYVYMHNTAAAAARRLRNDYYYNPEGRCIRI